MKTIHLFAIGLFALLFSGCVTSNVSFNNNPDYHTKIKSAFIEVKDVKIQKFLDGLGQTLIDTLEKNDVSIKLLVNDALSLHSENDIQKQVQNFHPDVIIILERVDTKMGHTKYGYYYDGGTYLMSVVLPETNKIVWKSSILTSREQSNVGGLNTVISQTIGKIIAKMKADQLL